MKLGMWLTDSYMTDKAKMLKKLLDRKSLTQHSRKTSIFRICSIVRLGSRYFPFTLSTLISTL